MAQRIGLYPGTFDPVTLGHMDIIRRGAKLVDKLVIGVTTNPSKSPMFSLDERLAMVRRECADITDTRIEVQAFDSLLIEYARSLGASLGMEVVAEGIESQAQLARVRELGCRYGQGFLLGLPQPVCLLAPSRTGTAAEPNPLAILGESLASD